MEIKYERVAFDEGEVKLCVRTRRPRAVGEPELRWHEQIDVLLVLAGSGRIQCGGAVYQVSKGSLLILDANMLHAALPGGTPEFEYCEIIPDTALCEAAGLSSFTTAFITAPRRDELALKLAEACCLIAEQRPASYDRQISGVITALLLHIGESCTAPSAAYETFPESPKVELVKKVLRYINLNFQKPIHTEDIAEYTGYSRDYLSHAFASVTGRTIVDYTNDYRCKKAQQLLITGSYSVSQALKACGFTNFSYFSKLYKQYNGVSPSDDIRSARKRL